MGLVSILSFNRLENLCKAYGDPVIPILETKKLRLRGFPKDHPWFLTHSKGLKMCSYKSAPYPGAFLCRVCEDDVSLRRFWKPPVSPHQAGMDPALVEDQIPSGPSRREGGRVRGDWPCIV